MVVEVGAAGVEAPAGFEDGPEPASKTASGS